MELEVPNANYSGAGLGNVRPVENYIINAQITNEAKKAALRAFYAALVTNNLINKFDVIALLNTGSAEKDRLNFLKPYDQAGNKRTVFSGDSPAAHTNLGYTPNQAAGRYATSESTISSAAQLANCHFHVFNKTADTIGHYLMGVFKNGGGTSLFIGLSRNASSKVTGGVTTHNSTPPVVQSADATYTGSTGLLSLSKNGVTQKLFHNGGVIGSGTLTESYTVATSEQIKIGTAGDFATFPSWVSTAQIPIVAWGFAPWSDAEEATFASIVNTFEAAMAAA